jgi:hypothetical protein
VSEPPLHAPRGVGVCPGCGALLPVEDGPTHPYMSSSPAGWARYGEVLAREFGDPRYFAWHQLTVDAYAAQHPGVAERRAIQSVGLHLMTLCMVIEDGADTRGPEAPQANAPTCLGGVGAPSRDRAPLGPPQPLLSGVSGYHAAGVARAQAATTS